MKKAYHFLGSVYFAVTLIGFTALFVIMGTVLESITDSHQFAAYYTYNHPAFLALLGLFFINILFAALRRWPFRWRHAPFLLTHLGLLMILGGTIVKGYYGTQGSMIVVEGGGSHRILLPTTYALSVTKRDGTNPFRTVSGTCGLSDQSAPFPELSFECIGFTPHSQERMETWIKGNVGVISGIKPFPVFDWSGKMVLSGRIRLGPPPAEPWNLMAFRAQNVEEVARVVYLDGLDIRATEHAKEIMLQNENVQFRYSPVLGFQEPTIRFNHDSIIIPLDGEEALQNKGMNQGVAVEITRTPTLLFVQDFHQDTYLFAFDSHGRVFSEAFRADNLSRVVVNDLGFGGYAAMVSIVFSPEGEEIYLECPLTLQHRNVPPMSKWEDCLPKTVIKWKKDGKEEVTALSYERYGGGLAWPILDGEYLVKFQPKTQEIPYHVRLRQARQINYAHSQQPYSYEGDIVVTDLRSGESLEKTISMNHVHETKDGYRFYLSSISPSHEMAVKKVQLVVNYDPAKRVLTYPGGGVLSAGIFLLFWCRKRRSKS